MSQQFTREAVTMAILGRTALAAADRIMELYAACQPQWTSAPPTVPGLWLWRETPTGRPTCYDVYRNLDGELRTYLPYHGCMVISCLPDDGQWSPIRPPGETP